MKFELNALVKIKGTSIEGEVIGRAEYSRAEPSYYVEHTDADGNPATSWFDEQRVTEEVRAD